MKAYLYGVTAAALGSLCFGWNMAYINANLEGIATDIFPCDAHDVYSGYSDACIALAASDSQELVKCQAWLTDYDEGVCGECEIPNISSCDGAVLYKALINAAPCFGALIGCLFLAPMFVKKGPRFTGIMNGGLQILACAQNACSNSFSALICGRVIMGLAVGIYSVQAPTYIQQVVPPEQRGKWGTSVQLMITLGIMISAFVGLAAEPVFYTMLNIVVDDGVINESTSFYAIETPKLYVWRYIVSAGVIPAIAAIVLYGYVCKLEPPMWLLMNNRPEEARESFDFFFKGEDERIFDTLQREASDALDKPQVSTSGVFKGEYLKTTLLAILFSVGQQVTGINVFITASNQLFTQTGMDAGTAGWMSTGLMVVNFIVNFPCMFLLDKFGRKTFMMFGIVFMTLGSLPAAIAYWIDEDAQGTAYTALVGCFVFIIAFGMTYGPILWIWLFEIFPEESKGKASSLGVGANWLAGTVMVFVGTYCTNNKVTFTIFAASCLIYCPLVFLLMTETKVTKAEGVGGGLPPHKSASASAGAELESVHKSKSKTEVSSSSSSSEKSGGN